MDTILTFVILIFSIIAHEVAHGYAANSLGDPTARLAGRLTFNPLPHIDLMGSIIVPAFLVIPALLAHSTPSIIFGWAKPVPYNPYNLRNRRWSEALVAVAGSATNISLAIIFGFIVRFGSIPLATGGSTALPAAALSLAATIAFVNLFLGLFNLIPFPPLDGFTAVRTLLPWNLSSGLSRFEYRVRGAGVFSLLLFLIVFSFIFSGVFFNFVFWLFGLIAGG